MVHEQKTSTPRQRRREATRQNILDTAMALVVSDGIDGLTIGRLAAEIDYTKGALYRYFPSKDAIFAALQVASIARIQTWFETHWSRSREELKALDPGPRSLALVLLTTELYGQLSVSMPADFALLRLAVGDPRQLISQEEISPVAAQTLSLLKAVASRIDEAVEAGALDEADAGTRATLLWASVHGNVLVGKFARLDPALFDTATLLRNLTHSLLAGWGASDDDLRAATLAVDGMEK